MQTAILYRDRRLGLHDEKTATARMPWRKIPFLQYTP